MTTKNNLSYFPLLFDPQKFSFQQAKNPSFPPLKTPCAQSKKRQNPQTRSASLQAEQERGEERSDKEDQGKGGGIALEQVLEKVRGKRELGN